MRVGAWDANRAAIGETRSAGANFVTADAATGREKSATDTMKIEVDLALCEDQAVCIGLAPSIFAFGEDGVLTVLHESPPEELREACEQAEAACPMAAIRLVE